jgi:hypothetical protein
MKFFVWFAFMPLISGTSFAQTDSLVFNNNDVIVGEIKEMSRGVILIETDYSDSDFKIEWEKIRELYSDQYYTVNLTDRTLLTNATIENIGPGRIKIKGERQTREVSIEEVVYIRQLDESFWSKMSVSIDVGFSLTKASNLRQYNADASIGYKTDQWTMRSYYRQVRSTQDEIDPITRTEGGLSGDYSLRNGIFFGASLNLLSNTEQQIDLRTTGSVGAGYYIIRNNHMYWNGFLGVAINNENFFETADSPSADRESYEGVVGTELNMYDVGDLNLFTNILWYPSFTEQGRNRVDYRFEASYDLPLDFYIKAGLTLNYDSDPAPGASDTDYVLVTGFGWKL